MVTAAVVLGVISAANADVTLEFGDYLFPPGDDVVITGGTLTGTLIGLEVSYDFGGNTDGSWASDAFFGISDPAGDGVEFGGFDMTLGLTPIVPDDGVWAAQNGDPQSVSETFSDFGGVVLDGTGTWSFYFADGWSGGTEDTFFGNITFTLIFEVPAPGALALFGLAGLRVRRRRRR